MRNLYFFIEIWYQILIHSYNKKTHLVFKKKLVFLHIPFTYIYLKLIKIHANCFSRDVISIYIIFLHIILIIRTCGMWYVVCDMKYVTVTCFCDRHIWLWYVIMTYDKWQWYLTVSCDEQHKTAWHVIMIIWIRTKARIEF